MRLNNNAEARRLTSMQRKILMVASKYTHIVLRSYEVSAARVLRDRGLLDFIGGTGSNTAVLTTFGHDLVDHLRARGVDP